MVGLNPSTIQVKLCFNILYQSWCVWLLNMDTGYSDMKCFIHPSAKISHFNKQIIHWKSKLYCIDPYYNFCKLFNHHFYDLLSYIKHFFFHKLQFPFYPSLMWQSHMATSSSHLARSFSWMVSSLWCTITFIQWAVLQTALMESKHSAWNKSHLRGP